MESLTREKLEAFLAEVGRRYPQSAQLYLIGGSALTLLGSPRPTLDVDYVGDDLQKNELQRIIDEVARDMHIEVDAVPIDGFIPLSGYAQERSLNIGHFGNLHVYVFDPYAIALSKVDRGFDTDIEDILFLIRQGNISLRELELLVYAALERADEFGLDARAMLKHLQEVRSTM